MIIFYIKYYRAWASGCLHNTPGHWQGRFKLGSWKVWWLFPKYFHRFLEFLHLQTKYLLQLCQWPLTALTLANLEFSLKVRLYFPCLLVSTLVLGAKKLPVSDVLACCVTAWTRPGRIYIPMHQLSMRPQAVDLKETSKKCKRNDYSAIESPAICVQSGL